MKAVVLSGHGDMDMLKYVDFPVPRPATDEVLIEVHACGMNNTDVWVREGAYGTDDDPDAVASWRRGKPTLEFPRIQGADTVGEIVAVGGNVYPSRIGERVMVDFSIYNTDTDSLADIDYIGHGADGGYAEYCVVPAANAHLVKNPMSDAELATFCCAYLTGEHMLDRARVAAGERVLISGAAGGVGGGLIQLCRARGAIPYAITSRDKADAVSALGAEGIALRDEGNWVEQVTMLLDGQPLDVVADVVGGPLFKDLINLLRPEGRYTTAGAFGGAIVELDLRTVYLKHLEIHGSSQGTRQAFKRLVGYIESGKVTANLFATYPLSEFHRAQTDFMAKGYVGKLVVMPDRFFHPV
ncbi:MAG: alcohol dehydrogenase family protein [Gammaproteobacteria bacterium]|nr:alcohol dehydrogenase family protein [Gammaproteobacteria bacterium]MDH3536380.1 alcohol dehydrogenase family protein [Gammaproteobacteria bacterium]